MRKKLDYEYCPASPMLEWMGDKWALVILLQLHEDGLVNRKAYPSIPPKVEYCLSELGKSFIPHLIQLKQWGQENFEAIMENRRKNKH